MATLNQRHVSRFGRNSVYIGVLFLTGFMAMAGFSRIANGVENSSSGGGEKKGKPLPAVHVMRISDYQDAFYFQVSGTIKSLNDSRIASLTRGNVKSIVLVGSEVARGDPIAVLDNTDVLLEIKTAELEIRKHKNVYEYAQRNLKRLSELKNGAAESEAVLDRTRSLRDTAMFDLENANNRLEIASTDLARTTIRAPFSGSVVENQVQIGEFAERGTAVARLVDTSNLEVSAQLAHRQTMGIAVGHEVTVVSGKAVYDSTVRAIIPVGNETSRTVELRLSLDNSSMYPGEAVIVRVPKKRTKNAVVIHRDGLLTNNGRSVVYVVDESGVARSVNVELGEKDGNLVEAIGDVSLGDNIVVRGAENIKSGQQVEVLLVKEYPALNSL